MSRPLWPRGRHGIGGRPGRSARARWRVVGQGFDRGRLQCGQQGDHALFSTRACLQGLEFVVQRCRAWRVAGNPMRSTPPRAPPHRAAGGRRSGSPARSPGSRGGIAAATPTRRSASSRRAGWRKSIRIARTANTRSCSRAQRLLALAARAQPFGARAFEERQVLRVVDHSAGVGIFPIHPCRPTEHRFNRRLHLRRRSDRTGR